MGQKDFINNQFVENENKNENIKMKNEIMK